MPGVTWEGENDRKLFLFLIKDSTVKFNYEGAAAAIATRDVPCTATAVESRIKKLRALAKKSGDGAGTKSPGDEAEAKPEKSLKGRGKKGVGKRNPEDDDGEDGDDGANPSPRKKGRKTVAGGRGKAVGKGNKTGVQNKEQDEKQGEEQGEEQDEEQDDA